ncbi:MAG: hypothetical protein IJX84_03850 [Clostridia bacterium]|nr:hypothetical protein [Clostridia bacterium]
MKKLLCLLFVLLFAIPAHGENIDLSNMSPEELQQLISAAQIELERSEEQYVAKAIELVKDYWKKEIYSRDSHASHDGYLEILNTQIAYVNRDVATKTEPASSAEHMFQNVYCVIDFTLLSDYFAATPSFYSNVNMYDSVTVYMDGTMELTNMSLILKYFNRLYSGDLSHILSSTTNCGSTYNAVFHLLEE